MSAQKTLGEERKAVFALLILLSINSQLIADTDWTSGHHEIYDGDSYGEIWMYNYATADMWGGDVLQLGALDSSEFSMFGGTMNYLLVRHNSVINIYGGDLDYMVIYNENGLVDLHAYDVVYHPTGGGEGYMDGKYFLNDDYFSFDVDEVDLSHINVVPEPTTFLFLGLGTLLLRKKR